MARKVAPQDAEKVKAEISKSSGDPGDLQLRNNVRLLVEKFTKYEPILDELDQVRKVVAQKQRQMSQGPAACEPGAAATPAGQIPTILEFIRPYITPPDPFKEMALKIMQSNLDLTDAIKRAVIGKATGVEAKSE